MTRRMGAVTPERTFDEALVEVMGEERPLLPEGRYQAVARSAHIANMHKGHKMIVEWDVIVPDPNHPLGQRSVRLRRYYNIKPAAGRRWRVGSSSNYQREWITITNRRPTRRDRLSPSVFFGVLAEVEVSTVHSDSRQRELHPAARYSVVSRVLSVVAGGGAR